MKKKEVIEMIEIRIVELPKDNRLCLYNQLAEFAEKMDQLPDTQKAINTKVNCAPISLQGFLI